MSIESEVYDRLVNDAGVSALTTRIYPARIPDKAALPVIRFFRVSTQRPSAMGSDLGLAGASFQIDCWAATQAGMIALRDAIRQAMQRFRDSGGSPAIQDIFIEQEQDHGFEIDLQAYRGSVDVLVWAEE